MISALGSFALIENYFIRLQLNYGLFFFLNYECIIFFLYTLYKKKGGEMVSLFSNPIHCLPFLHKTGARPWKLHVYTTVSKVYVQTLWCNKKRLKILTKSVSQTVLYFTLVEQITDRLLIFSWLWRLASVGATERNRETQNVRLICDFCII